MLSRLLTFAASSLTDAGQSGLRSLALGVGGGLGAAGAGVGIGIIFGKVIESVTRQPEMRDEITSIQWLGFAPTEPCVFVRLLACPLALLPSGPTTALIPSSTPASSG